jgi:hypothetical protein
MFVADEVVNEMTIIEKWIGVPIDDGLAIGVGIGVIVLVVVICILVGFFKELRKK